MEKVYWNGKETVRESEEKMPWDQELQDQELQDKEFVAYSKKLLRELKRIEAAMDEDLETAKTLLSQLIEDTRTDIED